MPCRLRAKSAVGTRHAQPLIQSPSIVHDSYAELNDHVWTAVSAANAVVLKLIFGLVAVVTVLVAARWLVRLALPRYCKSRVGPAGDSD